MRSKYEIKCQKELETEGWFIDNKAGMSRWSKNRDFFNLFDLVAVKKGEAIRYISIKGHNRGYGVTPSGDIRNEIKYFWLPECCIKELWVWPNNKKQKGWIKEVIPNEP